MKVVSVMTTDSSGGAEFAAVEMLDALAERGHETVMLSDMPGIGRDTRVAIAPIDIGPKLSTAHLASLVDALAAALWRLRAALRPSCPTTCCSSTTRRSS